MPAYRISKKRQKSLSLVRGRNKRAGISALGVVSDKVIAGGFLTMYEQHNSQFLVFDRNKHLADNPEANQLVTLVGSRWDKRPYNLLSKDPNKKLTKLNGYGLRLLKRGRHLGEHRKIEDHATMITLTLDPRRLMGLFELGFRECREHGDIKAIMERAEVDKRLAEARKEEYHKAKAENRKPKQISAKDLKLKKPSPWRVYGKGKKRKTYRPTLAGWLAMRLCDKLSTLDLTHESLSLRELSMLTVSALIKRFLDYYYKHQKAQGLKPKYVVSGIEPHKRTALPHVHMVFNQAFVAPIELLTKWWPFGGVTPKSSYGNGFRQKAHDAVSYAVKYAIKASDNAVRSVTAVKRLKDGTEEQRIIEYVNLFHAYAWFYGVRLFDFAHNPPVIEKEPEWLCIGINNGKTTHVFCRYRDDYKDSGTDWTEAHDPDPPPDDAKRGFTLAEARAFLDKLCGEV